MIKAKTGVGAAGACCLLALAACTVPPVSGPTVTAMPGQGKSFEQFQADDYQCRDYALASIGGRTPGEAAAQSAAGSAAVGTLGGAAVGALAGAAGGNAGLGAAAGAGAGLLLGSAAGAGASQQSYAMSQGQYNMTYVQCMASKGNQVPQYGAAAPAYGYPPGYRYPPPYAYPYGYPYRYYPYPGYY